MNFKNFLFWVTGFIGLVLDQITKHWVVKNLELGQTISLWEGIFHITYVTNKGAAFSMFSGGVGWLRWLSFIVSLGLIALAWFGPPLSRWEQAGYGFILAGAMGNGIDRFVAGEVVDFLAFPRPLWVPVFNLGDLLHFRYFLHSRLIQFPVFNLADVFINVGIVCLLIGALYNPPRSNSSGEHLQK